MRQIVWFNSIVLVEVLLRLRLPLRGTNQQLMTELQKDTMLANILEQVQSQITYLVEQDLIEESYALYKEWEEHFDESIRQLEVITIIDLTTI